MERSVEDFRLVEETMLAVWLVGDNECVKPEFAYNGEAEWQPLAARILDGMERIAGLPVRYLSEDDFSDIYYEVAGKNAKADEPSYDDVDDIRAANWTIDGQPA